jgi:hypothetical protein
LGLTYNKVWEGFKKEITEELQQSLGLITQTAANKA